MTVASLGFAIDSSQAAGAAADLDKLTSSAARAEQAAQKTGAAGTRMSRGFADLNPALDKIIGSLGRLENITSSIDKRLEMLAQAATRTAKATKTLDQSAIEASTSYKALAANLAAVTAAQSKADAAQAKSLSQIQKQKDALAALNAELQKLRNNPAVPGSRPPPANSNGGQAGVGNIAAQLFDTFSTAPFMNPGQVGLQQGPQFAQAFAGQSTKQALTSLAAGAAAIVSPVSLAAIGLTTAAAAAVGFGVSLLGAEDSTKKLDDALERHDGVLKRLEDRYGALIDKAKGYSVESSRILQFEAGADIRGLRNATKLQGQDFFNATGGSIFARNGASGFKVNSTYEMFSSSIMRLNAEMKAGKPDFEAFYDSIYKTAELDPKYAKKADELSKLVAQYREGTRALEEMERIQRKLFDTVGPNGMLLSQGTANQDDMGNLALFNSRNEVSARRNRQAFDADIFALGARSPQQRAEAARRSAASRYDDSESPDQRRVRIEQAGAMALAQAERQLSEAQRERGLNLDKILQDQQHEIDLVGKTGGAAAALRKEYELTSALRLEAARQGIDVDQKELDLIKQRAAALGELTDQYNQRRFNFDMGQQAGDARLSERDRQIITTLRGYGLPEDLGSANAGQIGRQLDWSEAKDAFKGFFSTVEQAAWENGGKIGDALGKGALNSLQKTTEKLWDNIFDRLATGLADIFLGSGGAGNRGAGAGGLIGSAAAALGGKAANDNFGRAPVGAVTRSALPDIGATTDIGAYIAKAAAARGIDPSIALRVAKSEGGLKSWNLQSSVFKNGVQEPSFGPYQLYMGGGLGNAFQKQTGLDPRMAANGPAGVNFALDHAAKNGWGAWYGAAKVGVGKWDGIGGGGSSAVDAVNGMAKAAGAATKGLDTFGGGLGKVGQALSTAPAATGGGGGFGGWLSSLFGGGGAFPAAPGGAAGFKGGPGIGLFASGTNYAPGGMAIVGEQGPELVDLPQGSQVFNANKSAQMMAANGNTQPANRKYDIHVYGGSGDDHIRGLVRDGIAQADAARDDGMRRGGFGEMQRAYASEKG